MSAVPPVERNPLDCLKGFSPFLLETRRLEAVRIGLAAKPVLCVVGPSGSGKKHHLRAAFGSSPWHNWGESSFSSTGQRSISASLFDAVWQGRRCVPLVVVPTWSVMFTEDRSPRPSLHRLIEVMKTKAERSTKEENRWTFQVVFVLDQGDFSSIIFSKALNKQLGLDLFGVVTFLRYPKTFLLRTLDELSIRGAKKKREAPPGMETEVAEGDFRKLIIKFRETLAWSKLTLSTLQYCHERERKSIKHELIDGLLHLLGKVLYNKRTVTAGQQFYSETYKKCIGDVYLDGAAHTSSEPLPWLAPSRIAAASGFRLARRPSPPVLTPRFAQQQIHPIIHLGLGYKDAAERLRSFQLGKLPQNGPWGKTVACKTEGTTWIADKHQCRVPPWMMRSPRFRPPSAYNSVSELLESNPSTSPSLEEIQPMLASHYPQFTDSIQDIARFMHLNRKISCRAGSPRRRQNWRSQIAAEDAVSGAYPCVTNRDSASEAELVLLLTGARATLSHARQPGGGRLYKFSRAPHLELRKSRNALMQSVNAAISGAYGAEGSRHSLLVGLSARGVAELGPVLMAIKPHPAVSLGSDAFADLDFSDDPFSEIPDFVVDPFNEIEDDFDSENITAPDMENSDLDEEDVHAVLTMWHNSLDLTIRPIS